jgi:hypothetical protein
MVVITLMQLQKNNNMNKTLLIDHIPHQQARIQLIESVVGQPKGLVKLRGKLQEAEQKNGNGRVYRRETLEREAQKYANGPIKTRTALGELDHPEAGVVSLANTSHVITKVWWEGNDLMGELELLNTPAGNIAKALIEAKIPLGISSRGMGSVKQMGETVEVQDDFELLCWDLVSVPSTPEAYMSLAESKQFKAGKDYSKINSLITEIICNSTGVCPLC